MELPEVDDPRDLPLAPTEVALVMKADFLEMYEDDATLPPLIHLLFVLIPEGARRETQLHLKLTFRDQTKTLGELEDKPHTIKLPLPEAEDGLPRYLILLPTYYYGEPPDDAEAQCRALFMGGVTHRFPEPPDDADAINTYFKDAGIHIIDVTDDSELRHPKAIEVGFPAGEDQLKQTSVTVGLVKHEPPIDPSDSYEQEQEEPPVDVGGAEEAPARDPEQPTTQQAVTVDEEGEDGLVDL